LEELRGLITLEKEILQGENEEKNERVEQIRQMLQLRENK